MLVSCPAARFHALYVCGSAGTFTLKAARALSLSRQRRRFHSQGSAGTFTLSRQREFTQRGTFTLSRQRECTQCGTSTCAHAEGGTEGGTEAVPGHVGGERACRTARAFEFVFEFVLSRAVSLGRSVSSGPAGV